MVGDETFSEATSLLAPAESEEHLDTKDGNFLADTRTRKATVEVVE